MGNASEIQSVETDWKLDIMPYFFDGYEYTLYVKQKKNAANSYSLFNTKKLKAYFLQCNKNIAHEFIRGIKKATN